MQLQDVPAQDKAMATVGAATSTLLSLGYVDKILAIVIGFLTILLLGLRVLIAYREWRAGKKPEPT